MSEEEKKAIETFISKCERFDGTVEIKGTSVGEETRILNTTVKFLKELNSLKEIEQLHQDNLTLVDELKQEKEKNKEHKTRIRNLECKIIQQKEQISGLRSKYHVDAWLKDDYISKDKIKKFIEEELPEEEICEKCDIYDVNGISIKKRLEKILEEK